MHDKQEESWRSAQILLRTFLLGSAVGASVAILVTPKTGKQIRGTIDDMMASIHKKKEAKLNEAKDIFGDNAAKMRESADEIKNRLQDSFRREREDSDYR